MTLESLKQTKARIIREIEGDQYGINCAMSQISDWHTELVGRQAQIETAIKELKATDALIDAYTLIAEKEKQ